MENKPDKGSEAIVNTIVRQPLAQGFPLMFLPLQSDFGTVQPWDSRSSRATGDPGRMRLP